MKANDGANSLEELDNAGNVLARYAATTDVDEPLSELRASTSSYYQQDGLGSVTSLSSSAPALTDTNTYDSFGKLTASTVTSTNPFRYTGREVDQETGIYYYRARYYDPQTGRFNSEDPLRWANGPAFYLYVMNSPVVLTDPLGLFPCMDTLAFANELDENKSDKSTHHCAMFVRWALEAGGVDTSGHPGVAKDYGPFLQNHGFAEVSSSDSASGYTPQPGDIVVIQPPAGTPKNKAYGHIAGYDGSQWVSDFGQNYMQVYASNPPYKVFRPAPCLIPSH